MKAEDLKTKTVDELNKILLETRKSQMNLRFQRSGGSLENTSVLRNTRRTIARVKTYLTQKQSGVQDVAPKAAAKKAPAKKKTEKKTAAKKKTAA